MGNLLNELRMLLADKLLSWAMKIAPASHPDGPRMIAAVNGYMEGSIARFEREHWRKP